MTTLAAIQGDGWSVIGADSQSSDSEGFSVKMPNSKIFKNNELIIAGAGQVRGINLLEHAWQAPAIKIDNLDKYVTSVLVPSIRKCFDNADYEFKEEKGSVENDNIFLVCARNQMYRIEEDYSWERNDDGIYVAGSGERLALGSLATQPKAKTVADAKKYIRKAITIAAKYDVFTGGDIKFMVST